jgi:hypothetical protein
MKKTLRLFTGLVCLGLAGISSTPALAAERSVSVHLAEIKGIGAECQAAHNTFNILYRRDSKNLSFLKAKKRSNNARANFVSRRSARDVARVITTSFTGRKVTVREVAVSKRANASCEFIYKSA